MFCLEELTSSLNATPASEDKSMQVHTSSHCIPNIKMKPVDKRKHQLQYCQRMYRCFKMCIPPDFCAFRMKTWSRLRWSSWDLLWPGIWPWLLSKRARWKPEYQHFVLYIKLKCKTLLFDNKTLYQTCSERIYSCSCSEHITSSSMYRPDTPKNQHVTSCHTINMTYYVHYTLSEDWYRKTTRTLTMTRLPDLPTFSVHIL